jgi:hypothetical protein
MTRLHVPILCERCGEQFGVDCGSYFGRQLGDQPIRAGLCIQCELEEMRVTVAKYRQEKEQEIRETTQKAALHFFIAVDEGGKKWLQGDALSDADEKTISNAKEWFQFLFEELDRLRQELREEREAHNAHAAEMLVFEQALGEIATHIRSKPDPVPSIVDTLKRTIPKARTAKIPMRNEA